ncbi:MAG: HAD family phosphatase [Bacteroidales bacterium]|nr:HAD family phosphatase [Bacteroidales bacterium]MDY0286342.1 HAD family phosphatase [Bacteroidales bacterium]
MYSPYFLIFDLDGLLIDSERLYQKVSFDLCATYGKVPSDALFQRVIGRKLAESMVIYVEMLELPISPETLYKMIVSRMKKEIKDHLDLMPGAREILSRFYGTLPMALATGSSMELLEVIFERTQIAHFFNVIQTSDTIKKGKPNPEIFQRVMKKFSASPSQCLILEDAQNGVVAAKKAGAYVIAVPNEYTRDFDFSSANCVLPDLYHASNHIAERIH